jgi:hypothetical protein
MFSIKFEKLGLPKDVEVVRYAKLFSLSLKIIQNSDTEDLIFL